MKFINTRFLGHFFLEFQTTWIPPKMSTIFASAAEAKIKIPRIQTASCSAVAVVVVVVVVVVAIVVIIVVVPVVVAHVDNFRECLLVKRRMIRFSFLRLILSHVELEDLFDCSDDTEHELYL